MKWFALKRIGETEDGTFGVLFQEGVPFAVTLERNWEENAKGKSCIPEGTYKCKRVNSPKFGNTFEVTEVPGRDAILFHKGNLEDDSHGCILVGEQFGILNNHAGIQASAAGFQEFLKRTENLNEFMIAIFYVD